MRIFFLVFILLLTGASSAPATQPRLMLEGISLGEWGIRWWQWATSAPRDKDPVQDLTGKYCAVGQTGQVWFLAGTYEANKKVQRKCTVPGGKSLLFPIINMYGECPSFQGQAAFFNAPRELKLTIDKVNFDMMNLLQLRGRVECGKSKKFPTLGFDGYYVALSPLTRGKHTIAYSARVGDFSQDVVYELTIQ